MLGSGISGHNAPGREATDGSGCRTVAAVILDRLVCSAPPAEPTVTGNEARKASTTKLLKFLRLRLVRRRHTTVTGQIGRIGRIGR